MKETFIVPLLHPYATSPIASPTMPEYDDMSRLETPVESFEHLPIASRFLSPTGFRSDTPTVVDHASRREDRDAANIDSESLNSEYEDENDRMGKGFHESRRGGQGNLNLASKHSHPRSPYGTSRMGKNTSVPFPSHSHQSLPPPRSNPNAASTQSLGRQSFVGPSSTEKDRDRDRKSISTNPSSRGMLRKSRKSLTKADLIVNGGVAPHQLPDDLRQCLEVIEDSILAGHVKLSEGLRKRYDEQYPLVRSLADVFVAHVRLFILLLLPWPSTYLDSSHTSSGVMRTMFSIWRGPSSKPMTQFQQPIQQNVQKIRMQMNGLRSALSCANLR